MNCVKSSRDSVRRAYCHVARVSASDVLLRVLGTVMFVLSLLWVESCGCNKVVIGWPPPRWAPNVGWSRLGNMSPLVGMVLLVGCKSWNVVFLAVEDVLRRCLGVDCVRLL